MRIVADTNVFVSGVFFTGPPCEILDAWRQDIVQLVVSPEILDEYRRVGKRLADKFSAVDLEPALELLRAAAIVVDSLALPEAVCRDPHDDKFLACAIVGRAKFVISGDKALLETSGYRGITVLKPRDFLQLHLTRKK